MLPQKQTIKTSLIISVYNRSEVLNLCFSSLLDQSQPPDEIIIADDGSAEETRSAISEFSKISPVPVVHVWHEDIGFRKTIILNKAIAKCAGDYIIQIDGDLILHKHFIKDHIHFAKDNMFVCGSRVKIEADLVKKISNSGISNIPKWSKGLVNPINGMRCTALTPLFQRWHRNNKLYVRGCNMAFWKKDCILVNGYNEDILGWGREDSEFACRLSNTGILKRFLKFSAIVYHLDHPKYSTANLQSNDDITQKAVSEEETWCDKGIDKYL